jgi:hypothetical protein
MGNYFFPFRMISEFHYILVASSTSYQYEEIFFNITVKYPVSTIMFHSPQRTVRYLLVSHMGYKFLDAKLHKSNSSVSPRKFLVN